MAFFYCYQPPPHQQSAQPVPQSPQSTTPELNTPLPSQFLLSPESQQQNFTLPMLSPVLPPVSLNTTAETTVHNDQQQLSTPNTFIRHCEDMGIFHDLQNMIVMSSPSSGSLGNTVTTTATATSVTINMCTSTTSLSKEQLFPLNAFESLSNSGLKTVMMDNPFDKTFKQAVLQQQKKDSKMVENHLNNINITDGELNTPFIATTFDFNKTVVDISKSEGKTVSDLVTTFSTVEPKRQNSTFIPLTTEATYSSVLEKMVEQKKTQKPYSTISIQRQHQNHFLVKQRPIAPASMLTTSKKIKAQNFVDKVSNKNIMNLNCFGSQSMKAKQALKQNLSEKQQLQEQLRLPVLSEKYHELKNTELQKNDVDVVSTTTVELGSSICNNNDNQIIDLKKKQALLERNRTAAQRSRKKRKEKWELLTDENRKLKIENNQLRRVISKLIGKEYTALPHQIL